MGLRVLQMTGPRWITAANGAFLEMTLEDVTARKRIIAQEARVRPVTSVTKQMPLQVLRVQVCLLAVWARKLPILILDRHDVGSSSAGAIWRNRRRSSIVAG